MKREAKAKGGFFVEDEPALAFVVRIRGINDMHPKSRKILQLLRLKQIHNGVFVKVSAAQMGLVAARVSLEQGHGGLVFGPCPVVAVLSWLRAAIHSGRRCRDPFHGSSHA